MLTHRNGDSRHKRPAKLCHIVSRVAVLELSQHNAHNTLEYLPFDNFIECERFEMSKQEFVERKTSGASAKKAVLAANALNAM